MQARNKVCISLVSWQWPVPAFIISCTEMIRHSSIGLPTSLKCLLFPAPRSHLLLGWHTPSMHGGKTRHFSSSVSIINGIGHYRLISIWTHNPFCGCDVQNKALILHGLEREMSSQQSHHPLALWHHNPESSHWLAGLTAHLEGLILFHSGASDSVYKQSHALSPAMTYKFTIKCTADVTSA